MDKQQLTKYLYAFSFGDGCIAFPKKKKPDSKNNAIMIINHIVDNEDYIFWKKSILDNLTSTYIYLNNYDKSGKRKDIYRLSTARHPILTKIYHRMYLNGKKVIDPHFRAFLDWETMAIIFQDDGCMSSDKSKGKTINLSTNNFSYGDQLMFRDWCAEDLSMHFSIVKHMNSYRLRLSAKCFDEFIENVSPFVFPSFGYKVGLSECQAPSG